jgi:hypothetical protein
VTGGLAVERERCHQRGGGHPGGADELLDALLDALLDTLLDPAAAADTLLTHC